jgi:hypothetical protein
MSDGSRRREERVGEARAAYQARVKGPSGPEPAPGETPPDSRDVEVRWIEEHNSELRRRYAGQWIVVEGEALVAHHRNLQEAVQRASRRGVHYPFVLFIRSKRYEGAYKAV